MYKRNINPKADHTNIDVEQQMHEDIKSEIELDDFK